MKVPAAATATNTALRFTESYSLDETKLLKNFYCAIKQTTSKQKATVKTDVDKITG